MIFVVLGTQKFQFNRLLKEIDKLIDNGTIKEEVFAQIGNSTYEPLNFNYSRFIEKDEYDKYLEESRLVICHGGTGAIINSINKHKKVIAIARLSKFKEHVDDHQKEIISQFHKSNYIMAIESIEELGNAIKDIDNKKFDEFISNTDYILDIIKKFIKG